MVFSWSAFGGDSTTSRLNVSGAADSLVGGYGPESEARRRLRAFIEGGECGWWLADQMNPYTHIATRWW